MPRPQSTPPPLPPLPAPTVRPHERLRALLRERGLSQAQLAALAGVRNATVVEIERGGALMPNQGTLRKFAAVLGMSVDGLRRQTGMYGPLYVPPVVDPAQDAVKVRRFSPRAEQIAALVDTLPVKEQTLIETLCRYFRARRDVRLSEREMVGQA